MSNFPVFDETKDYLYFGFFPKDLQAVSAVAAKMADDGCNIFADETQAALTENSLKMLVGSKAVVLFITRGAVCSHAFRSTMTAAISMNKKIITVFMERTALTITQRLQAARTEIIEWKGDETYAALYENPEIKACRTVPEKPVCLEFSIIREKTGESAVITGESFAVGRSEAMTDFTVKGNGAISRLHVVFRADNTSCAVIDQNSSNATYLNGRELTPMVEYEVKNGDVIELADEKFNIVSKNR